MKSSWSAIELGRLAQAGGLHQDGLEIEQAEQLGQRAAQEGLRLEVAVLDAPGRLAGIADRALDAGQRVDRDAGFDESAAAVAGAGEVEFVLGVQDQEQLRFVADRKAVVHILFRVADGGRAAAPIDRRQGGHRDVRPHHPR